MLFWSFPTKFRCYIHWFCCSLNTIRYWKQLNINFCKTRSSLKSFESITVNNSSSSNIHFNDLSIWKRSLYTVSQIKNETPLFISIQIIVQKWDWYQSSWIIVYFSLMPLKFFLGIHLHGGSLPNFNFFNVSLQIFQWNRKVHLSNCLETNFHNISNISLRVIRRRNYS